MKPSVQAAFFNFSTRFEGRLNFMYLEIKKTGGDRHRELIISPFNGH